MEAALSQSFGDVHKDLKVLFLIKGRTGKTHPLGFPKASVHLQTAQEKTKANHRLGNSYSQIILECQKMLQIPISGTHSHPLHSRKDILWLLHWEPQNFRLYQQVSQMHQLHSS
ncbi:hypothetical protein AVEN_24006-1 [Araneus ventricosus]|uniref:Uncharacterized protein n=1 Tax=Araneus ventricosus TaxID=182803 RepID=A0A4Y2D022_ARAVE|nr:hypothetical protein AVEN_24006-1 [Araneus ventricosus]